MKIKCESASLVSKEIISEYATDIENYGSKFSIFAAAEKSQSFRKQIQEFLLVFRTEEGFQEFKVGKEVFDKYSEGMQGELHFNKKEFVDFIIK